MIWCLLLLFLFRHCIVDVDTNFWRFWLHVSGILWLHMRFHAFISILCLWCFYCCNNFLFPNHIVTQSDILLYQCNWCYYHLACISFFISFILFIVAFMLNRSPLEVTLRLIISCCCRCFNDSISFGACDKDLIDMKIVDDFDEVAKNWRENDSNVRS